MPDLMSWGLQYALRTYYNASGVTLSSCGVSADSSGWNSATADADAFASGAIGVASNKYGIPLLNKPAFDPGQAVVNQRKAIGVSYRRADAGFEYQQGSRVPTTTFEFDVTYKNIVPFLWMLFQGGTTEGAGATYLKTFVPYTESNAEIYVASALLARNSDSAATSHMIGGAVVKSLTLTAEEGMPLKCSAEMIGYNMVSDFDLDADANLIEYDTAAPLLWQNATVSLGGTTVNIPGFSLTISNNLVTKNYDSWHTEKYVLMDCTAEGSFRIPWSAATVGGNAQIDNFINGTDQLLKVTWGTGSHTTDGDFEIEVNARYTGATLTGDDEIVTEIPFENVFDGTNNLRLYSVDSINRLV
jgi:hypothetical protein